MLFLTDFLGQLQVWQRHGDRLLIFMDMNKLVLRGTMAHHLLSMGLIKATHQYWGNKEPHTFINGVEPIVGVWHTANLEVSAVVQLSFHEGLGDHHTVLVDLTTYSAIGKHDFKVVRLEALRLNSTNTRVCSHHILYLEGQSDVYTSNDGMVGSMRAVHCQFPYLRDRQEVNADIGHTDGRNAMGQQKSMPPNFLYGYAFQ
jgi:hypothetical protein